tara:strand:- start:350 stop:1612 length:1263 start_codon:yes stop_codon:yes gene_type:complete
MIIKRVKIIDPNSQYNGKVKDVKIENGTFVKIATNIESDYEEEVLEFEESCMSPGWFDLFAVLKDPGFEYKEDFGTCMAAAEKGGFTGIALMPNTRPYVQNKSEIEYIKSLSKRSLVEVVPLGCTTKDQNGKELTEMFDMYQAGALGFCDGLKALGSDILLRALQYVKQFDGVVFDYPNDASLAVSTTMHEGNVSAALGLKGMPSIAEVLGVQRGIALLKYTKSKLHFAHITSKESLSLIRSAKEKGLNITVSVSSLNLMFNDRSLEDFDTNYKLKPFLRSEEDRLALIEAVKDGLIDVVCSNHNPEDQESKDIEFLFAKHGAINLETSFSALIMAMGENVNLNNIVQVLALNPRNVLGLEVPVIEEGKQANVTIFDPYKNWTYSISNKISTVNNSPFLNKEIKGKALAVYNDGRLKKLE